MAEALLQTNLPLPKRSGKVRDVYDLGDALLIVATDRISAYDCVMPNGIPGKGKILTALSLFWFRLLAGRVKNHLLATEVQEYPAHVAERAAGGRRRGGGARGPGGRTPTGGGAGGGGERGGMGFRSRPRGAGRGGGGDGRNTSRRNPWAACTSQTDEPTSEHQSHV